MPTIDYLHFHLGAELEKQGGVPDQLDYRRLRRLGVQLRNIAIPDEDWDHAPANWA
jgi:hypothetical protein